MSARPEFTHLDDRGRVRMVDVSDKPSTARTAVAQGVVRLSAETFERIRGGRVEKGNVLETARIAGVMAAKRTADLIPMCHPLPITHARVDFTLNEADHSVGITAVVRITGATGVEMEALTAVSVAGLTIYDMCKALDRAMTLTDIRLVEKSGGRSGHYVRGAEDPASE